MLPKKGAQRPVATKVPLLLVPDMLKFMDCHSAWNEFLQTSDRAVLRDFWKNFCSLEENRGHGAQRHPDMHEWLLPLSLHIDGVVVYNGSGGSYEVDAISFSSIARGSARTTRNVIMQLPSHLICDETREDVCAVLAWTFRHLGKGLMPSIGPSGECLGPPNEAYALPWRAFLIAVKMDAKARQE